MSTSLADSPSIRPASKGLPAAHGTQQRLGQGPNRVDSAASASGRSAAGFNCVKIRLKVLMVVVERNCVMIDIICKETYMGGYATWKMINID